MLEQIYITRNIKNHTFAPFAAGTEKFQNHTFAPFAAGTEKFQS